MSRRSGSKVESGLGTAEQYMAKVLDEIDEERAKRTRQRFGLDRWLVSWSPLDAGGYLARVSAPHHDETIEATGRNRLLAIEAAASVLRKLEEAEELVID